MERDYLILIIHAVFYLNLLELRVYFLNSYLFLGGICLKLVCHLKCPASTIRYIGDLVAVLLVVSISRYYVCIE